MTKTLADLRAVKPVGRRESTVSLCLAPHLVAEIQALTAKHDRLAPAPTSDDDEPAGPPRRVGGARPEGAALRARIAELLEEMREYEGELTIRANLTDGEWRRWTNDHPARDEGEPGYDRDQRVTAGFCDADALIDALGLFVHQWNSEPTTAEDWAEVFEPSIGTADKADVASRVVGLYESRLDFQGLRSALSPILKRLNDSSSPATSGSPTGDSTVGSPESSTSTTTTTKAESQAS